MPPARRCPTPWRTPGGWPPRRSGSSGAWRPGPPPSPPAPWPWCGSPPARPPPGWTPSCGSWWPSPWRSRCCTSSPCPGWMGGGCCSSPWSWPGDGPCRRRRRRWRTPWDSWPWPPSSSPWPPRRSGEPCPPGSRRTLPSQAPRAGLPPWTLGVPAARAPRWGEPRRMRGNLGPRGGVRCRASLPGGSGSARLRARIRRGTASFGCWGPRQAGEPSRGRSPSCQRGRCRRGVKALFWDGP